MARLTEISAFKRDNLLLEFLKAHKGIENIVSRSEIADYLTSYGWTTRADYINGLVKKVMYQFNAPICYQNGNGYYWAKTRNEIEQTVADMESRQRALQEYIDHLRNFII